MDLTGKTKVTPSKHNPFVGTPLPDSQMTRAQERKAEMMRGRILSNRERYRLPENYKVRLFSDGKGNEPVSVVYWLCPVISCTKDRKRLRVIAPDGTDTWVDWNQS